MTKGWTLIFIAFVFSSCCHSGAWEIPSISVRYPNLTSDATLNTIRTDAGSTDQIIDTISVAELNAANFYSGIVEFDEDGTYNYIVYVEGQPYQDTITNIQFNRAKCSNDIDDLTYNVNGEFQDAVRIVIE